MAGGLHVLIPATPIPGRIRLEAHQEDTLWLLRVLLRLTTRWTRLWTYRKALDLTRHGSDSEERRKTSLRKASHTEIPAANLRDSHD